MAIDEDVAKELERLRGEIRTLKSAVVSMGLIADDDELDGRYGDPVVRFSPRQWRGTNFKGSKYSECEAEFLDVLAGALTSMADKDQAEGKMYNGKPSHIYSRKDAARARGWSLRIKAGVVKRPEPEAPALASGDSLFGGSPGFQTSSAPFGGSGGFGGSSAFGAASPPSDTGASDLGDDDEIPF